MDIANHRKKGTMKAKYSIGLLLIIAGFSCNKNPDDSSINIFSVDDDIRLGQQVSDEIASDPQAYPILDPVQYANAYAYVNTIRNRILNG